MRLLWFMMIVITASIQAQPGARWLRFCDKQTQASFQSLAWEDAPMRTDLLDSLQQHGWIVRNQYRWENLVSAVPGPGSTLPNCVEDRGPVAKGRKSVPPQIVASRKFSPTAVAGINPVTLALQKIWDAMGIESVRQTLLQRRESAGNGVTIAVIDGRFALQHQALQGVNFSDSWDFVDSTPNPWDSLKNGSFSEIHGASTAGLIGSHWDGLPGIAPGANFLLYRAEDDASESAREEDNLAAALVRAVDHGAQVISISLGYRFYDDYDTIGFEPWLKFDGKTLVASRAATAAARHGALVVVASGNDARVGSRSIGSPADADSVLVVGAMSDNRKACNFSSWGPTADGRPKPEVAAFGCYVPVAGAAGVQNIDVQGAGTSFATPLVAGLAVLARQLLPGISAWRLLNLIKASGDRASAPDSVLGTGLPDLRKMFPDLTRVRSMALPPHWAPALEPLVFQSSSAQGGGNLEVVIASLNGRVLFRRSGPYQTGSVLWDPSGSNSPRPGMLVVSWWGDYGKGSQTVLVLP